MAIIPTYFPPNVTGWSDKPPYQENSIVLEPTTEHSAIDIPIPVTPKPGYMTTEFWISLIAAAVGACLTLGVFKTGSPWEKIIGVLSMTLAAIGYTAGRSAVKAAALKMCIVAAMLMTCGGCALFNPQATEQQKLDSAKQTYTNANNVISLLIVTGYIAKNDQALKDAIFQASATIRDSLNKAQDYLTAGNKVTFQFWFDQAMNGLSVFLQYQADGERKHKLSDPQTRPSLPQRTTDLGFRSGYFVEHPHQFIVGAFS
jgi:hypothetical protein